jgi:lipopolysaccharide assembly outer membrane protein LptD (OstA)
MRRRLGSNFVNCVVRRAVSFGLAAIIAVGGGWIGAAPHGKLGATGPGFTPVWAQGKESSEQAATAKPRSDQKKTAPKGSQENKEEEKDKVIIDADDLRYDGQRKLYVLRRNVRIQHKDTQLTCDWAEYHEDTDSAVARGNLLLKDPESTVTGDVINVDFTDETAVVEGNVVIVTQKKKKGEEAKGAPEAKSSEKSASAESSPPASHGESAGTANAQENEEEKRPKSIAEMRERKTTIYCTKLRYHYTEGERYAWLTGPIRAEQKDRTAWADNAEYDGEDGILKLTGNVRVTTGDGDEFQCPAAVVSVEDEWLRAEKVTGVAVRRKKAKEESAPVQQPPGSEQAKPVDETDKASAAQ